MPMRLEKTPIFVFLLLSLTCFGQKDIDYDEQTWFGYLNQTRITNRSGLWLDVHLRFGDNFLGKPAVGMIRGAYIFYLNDQNRLASGYAHITQYSTTEKAPDIPEHRLWQQIQWFEKKNWLSTMQYVRLEERFRQKVEENELASDYSFNYRVRYAIALAIPLKGKPGEAKTPFVFLNDELMINFGSEITNNYFDQNRFFAGIGYQFTRNLNAHLGYLNVFQQFPQAETFRQVNGIRLFIFHNLDLRPDDR